MQSGERCKLVSLNIEKDKHVAKNLPFFKQEKPDVLCLQEVYEKTFAMYKRELACDGAFAPMTWYPDAIGTEPMSLQGVAILSPHEIRNVRMECYAGDVGRIPTYRFHDVLSYNLMLLVADIVMHGVVHTVATTHFTWTPDGLADDAQRKHLRALLPILDTISGFILCGDFNAPRGREIFSALAERYSDNIPPTVTTTIDPVLHRAPHLQYVVDVLFSTPQYVVHDVSVVEGVSDHKAIIGTIEKS